MTKYLDRKLDFEVWCLSGNEIKTIGLLNESINYETSYANWANLPHYSSKIEDAWELFEESEEPYLKKMSHGYECVMRDKNLKITAQAQGATAPEAICRAWIKWKESQQ